MRLEQAQQTPGYQFTAQQGSKGILEGAGAAGGAISGGTLKSLASFNTNLANSTYSNIYNQALSTYGAQLTGQQQSFSQLLGTAQLGAGAATSTNQTGTASAANLSNLLSSLGQSQAAGTVGSANALTSGLTGGTNNLSQMILLSQLLQGGGAGTNSVNPTQIPQGVTDFGPSGIPPTMPSSTQMPTLYGEVPG